MLCLKCGKEINDNATFCDSCGQPCGVTETAGSVEIENTNVQPAPIEQSGSDENIVEQKTATTATKNCGRCGNQIQSQVMFCDKCGLQQVNFPIANTQDFSRPKTKKKHPRRKLCIAGAVLIVLITIVVAIVSEISRVDFEWTYKELIRLGADPAYCTVAADGSYLSIDTNPQDIKDYYEKNSYAMIKKTNEHLGFTEALWKRMAETRSIDGRQSEENDKVKVTWTYHPDKGTEVTYIKK